MIKGEEVSDRLGAKPIRINRLDISTRVEPQHGATVVDVIQRNVDAIRSERRAARESSEFRVAIAGDDLLRVEHHKLFEIYNGHIS